jgi:hypothetical protein
MDLLRALFSEDECYLVGALDCSMSSYLEWSGAIRHAEKPSF